MNKKEVSESSILLNWRRAVALMEQRGLDALIASTAENVLYASGFGSLSPFVFRDMDCFALCPVSGNDPALVIPKGELFWPADRMPWVEDIVTYGNSTITLPESPAKLKGPEERLYGLLLASEKSGANAVEALVKVLNDRGLKNGKLGLDEIGVSPQTAAAIREALPKAQVVDAFHTWREIRAVKMPEEIRRLREVARVNEGALSEVYNSVAEGVDLHTLYQVYVANLANSGGEFTYWDSGVGSQSCSFFPSSDYRARPSDLVRIDGSCTWGYYWSDTGRTLVLDEPNGKIKAYYSAIRAGVEAGLEMVRPGIRASEVFDRIMETVKREGIPHYYRFHCGHGLGLEFYEIPAICPAPGSQASSSGYEDTVLEEGMVFNIEAPYYELGFGGMQLEESVLVTADGYECLTQWDREMMTVSVRRGES